MKGIHPSIASHKLNVFPAARPVRQKIRRFHPDRQKVIRNEIDKLLEAGFIREVSYPDWLANVVVVPKEEGKWRVCVDYTNLNNACPKDSFPLPRIDQIVDSTSGQGMLSFLDAFSGYHQIPISPDDEEKTAFITPHGLYCYKVMPFGLKNVGATYQRLMTKIFKPLISHTVEVYIDDIVLNPSKCAFGVSAGKFLGFMVSQRGIEVSPDQVKAVIETPPPRNKKELQRLTGKLVALGRFIARFTDEFLIPKEKLYMYLAVSEWAISAVLFRCPSPKEQKPVYYVSRALADVETSILHKPDLTGRMLQWAIELSEFGIEFQPRLSKKGQVMADFVLEYSRRPNQHHESSEQEWWTLGVNGASRSSGSGVGLLLQSPTGEHLEQAIRLGFSASNNEAEYEAILSGLDLALALSISKLRIYSDSQLVQFTEWTIEKIKRTDNGRADALAGIAASLPIREAILLPIHVQTNPSVTENSTCNTIEADQADDQEWTHDIAEYLRTGTLPEDPKQAHKIRVQAARFTLIGEHLYKRSFTGPHLRCLGHPEAQYVLAELHEGICGNHTGGRSLAHRAHSQGYYWPTMKKDAAVYVQKCNKCQIYAPIPHMPSAALKSVSGPWPFAQWGMDIVGPLPAAPAQKKFLLVATDYFSKWVEAEAYASIKDKDVTKFVWKNIVCRFGIPQIIIADNGPQFDSIAFRNFCSELNIRNSYSTPRYPQSNGQAEATNKTLINALKKRLEQAKGK
ncbi:Transposon Ty3-I Gag-Pol polyprotein [Vitis vinifera]|uniref:Transposon Ty3-I Gag-Pol polyprotein n=1 Tax=Vitis vinifera TaxID=29760 RepID=A0A438HCQ3_VITVI|nr:Transposon Ty3-I Gag-Pol polyprotein [Vitis vinifera]